jgi:hypothetical protein
MSKRALWTRIHDYHFDHIVQPELRDKVVAMFGGADASTQAFASKLAAKLGWSRQFALRAIEEYKKFLYLGNIGAPNVTPSRVIDKVWHEHILFSRGYREFCRDVLRRDFDHNPELVPMAEQNDVFAQQYLDTLDAYRTEFNTMPPVDIWSVPKFREVEKKRAPRRLEHAWADSSGDSIPLYEHYPSPSDMGTASEGSVEFGGSGQFHGGGSSGSWDDSDSASHDGNAGDSGAGDSGGGDSGGSSCGSSCSSSCGGGGGGE